MSSKGLLKRTISHWTGGGWRANDLDKSRYHRLTEVDGTIVYGKNEPEDNIVVSDGEYAAHTLRLNTGSIGCAMCGMLDATEVPLSFGDFPISERQFEAHCRMLAELHIEYSIPVTDKTCLTHAEVEPRLGVRQAGKWDIKVLKWRPDLRSALAVGDYMRSRVRHYMSEMTGVSAPSGVDRPDLYIGSKGAWVRDAQTQLSMLGFHSGKIDGIYGERTRGSVAEFQISVGLHADGIIGPNTWAALHTAKPRPKREISAEEIKATSRIAKDAEMAKKGLTSAEWVSTATVAMGGVAELNAAASQAETALEVGQRVLFNYWPLLLLLLAVVIGSRYGKRLLDRIIDHRVEDGQTGAHIGAPERWRS